MKTKRFFSLILCQLGIFIIIITISYLLSNNTSSSNIKGYNIFFVETNFKSNYFNKRELCGIESAALNNPNGIINVYTINAKIDSKLLQTYSNIKLIKLNLNKLFKNTYFENWYRLNEQLLIQGPYAYAQISDLFRVVVLYKYGGYYSDLDTITIKSIEPLLNYNGFGLQSDYPIDINLSNLIFSKNHLFLHEWMSEMIDEPYNKTRFIWGSIGKNSVNSKVEKLCETKLDNIMIKGLNINNNNNRSSRKFNKSKHDLSLFSTRYFSPLNWFNWEYLFISNQFIDISIFIDAYSVHFFSKFSSKATIGMKSIYEFYAKRYCPISFGE
jgi:lactosylceramide 4-alpha-galactosyltransferase